MYSGWIGATLLTTGLIGSRAGAQQSASQVAAEASPVIDDRAAQAIVVTGRRYDPARPKREAIAYFREYCFESNRLKRHSTAPNRDADWLRLDDTLRAKLKLDPETPAYELIDAVRGYTLILKIEELKEPDNLQESRCSIIVVGGTIHSSLVQQMSALFQSPPAQEDVDAAEGVKLAPGWCHWLWTAMPGRKSQNWEQFRANYQTSHWITVTNANTFYNNNDYLLGDLKTNLRSPLPISVMSFAFIRRDGG
jgi:hypothetical protein